MKDARQILHRIPKNNRAMNPTSELYQRLSARRNALLVHYSHNDTLKSSDPDTYQKYQGELRDLNRKLRLIRGQMEENPTLHN